MTTERCKACCSVIWSGLFHNCVGRVPGMIRTTGPVVEWLREIGLNPQEDKKYTNWEESEIVYEPIEVPASGPIQNFAYGPPGDAE